MIYALGVILGLWLFLWLLRVWFSGFATWMDDTAWSGEPSACGNREGFR